MSIFDPTVMDTRNNTASMFQPYTVTTGTGTTQGTVGGNFGTQLSGPLNTVSNMSTVGAGQSQAALQDSMAQNQGQFSNPVFNSANQGLVGGMQGANFMAPAFDINQATDQYFQQGMDVLNPAFAQQNANLAQSLQGSGRGGLMLSSGAMGAGGGGMVNPDMYNTGAAQNNALANLYQQSRQSALGEQNQMFGQGLTAEQQRMNAGGQLFNQDLATGQQNYNQNLGGFEANQAQMNNLSNINQQQMANLGLFGTLENNLFSQGLAAEQVRSGANASSMYNPQTQESLPSSLTGAAVAGLAGNANIGAMTGGMWDAIKQGGSDAFGSLQDMFSSRS